MVRRYDEGCRHCRVGSGPSVAGEAARAFACDGGDDPGRVHLADAIAGAFPDVEIAFLVQRHRISATEKSRGGGTAIFWITTDPGPGYDNYHLAPASHGRNHQGSYDQCEDTYFHS